MTRDALTSGASLYVVVLTRRAISTLTPLEILTDRLQTNDMVYQSYSVATLTMPTHERAFREAVHLSINDENSAVRRSQESTLEYLKRAIATLKLGLCITFICD